MARPPLRLSGGLSHPGPSVTVSEEREIFWKMPWSKGPIPSNNPDDNKVGTGVVPKKGQTVTVNCTGIVEASGKKFWSS